MRNRVKQLSLWLLMSIFALSFAPSAAAAGGEVGVIDVSVTAVWDDDNNDAGERPDSVTVVLVRDETDTELTAVLSAANGWSAVFPGLPASDGVYTVREQTPDGYLAEYDGDAAKGFVITNVKLTEIPDDPIPLGPIEQTPADTGSNEGSYLYLLLALSIALFIGGRVLSRKRRKNKK